jgi:hypothetical protein
MIKAHPIAIAAVGVMLVHAGREQGRVPAVSKAARCSS